MSASNGQLEAPRDLPVGGQAVLEGVMMRGVSTWAVAVRKPTPEQLEAGELDPEEGAKGEIDVVSFPLVSYAKEHRWARLPVLRGVVALVESLKIGFKALEHLGQRPDAARRARARSRRSAAAPGSAPIVFAMAFAIGLFFLLPAGLTKPHRPARTAFVFVLIEKAVRLTIFLAYILLISQMRDLRRVFEYHGAEHKTISCYEAGLDLTPENAQRFSRLHPRCGTSFLLIVMIVAIFVFAPLGQLDWQWLFISRVVGIPLVAGLAFEVIKWLGRNRTKRWARALMWPGLQLQRLTTREPDLSQLAVAIAALEAVLAVENPAEATEEDKIGMEVVRLGELACPHYAPLSVQ